MKPIRIATFRVDVTPPVGAPLSGGWIPPVASAADPLSAIGAVLLSGEAPLILCAVDWCEINNDAHAAWRDALAAAVGTTSDRVALHTVHQHNAPIADLEAQALVEAAGMGDLVDRSHFRACVARTAEAARASLAKARPVDRIAVGIAPVHEVASARRILGADGKVRLTRWSSTRAGTPHEQELRDEPAGTIDPLLRTVTFLDDASAVASFHYYATHPMSYYGDGVVSSDFAGLARDRRAAETPGCEHLYFNGCGGNVTAGKYNEGTPESRQRLSGRITEAIRESERNARGLALERLAWATLDCILPPRPDLEPEALLAKISDGAASQAERKMAALKLSYLRRLDKPVKVTRLRLAEGVNLLGLPGEAFVEYQLFANRLPGFTAVAAYGDTGTGYIPLARSYAEGGYEPTASSVGPATEAMLRSAIVQLVAP